MVHGGGRVRGRRRDQTNEGHHRGALHAREGSHRRRGARRAVRTLGGAHRQSREHRQRRRSAHDRRARASRGDDEGIAAREAARGERGSAGGDGAEPRQGAGGRARVRRDGAAARDGRGEGRRRRAVFRRGPGGDRGGRRGDRASAHASVVSTHARESAVRAVVPPPRLRRRAEGVRARGRVRDPARVLVSRQREDPHEGAAPGAASVPAGHDLHESGRGVRVRPRRGRGVERQPPSRFRRRRGRRAEGGRGASERRARASPRGGVALHRGLREKSGL
mmetsp:Transcript_5683/g.20658  ORF Transcript_5683/g.20658 Transcript_5683/m.20658 type:complete len:278 (-) Transcript_5683:258-1091(-)